MNGAQVFIELDKDCRLLDLLRCNLIHLQHLGHQVVVATKLEQSERQVGFALEHQVLVGQGDSCCA